MSLFTEPHLRIRNSVRLIEMFSGIGAQAKAFDVLGVPFERWRSYDIDKAAVRSYNAIHGTSFEPMDITQIHAEDLGIVDREQYTYFCTYSFPCQDLSASGMKKGMRKGSGTRSGLLWEVERILLECGKNLPQILLMENVPQVCKGDNKHDFDMWKESLRSMGYTNTYRILNALDYGVPQNRERCFMLSWLKDYQFVWPEPIHLTRCLADVMETDIPEKYYLTEKQISTFVADSEKHRLRGNGFKFDPLTAESTHTHTLQTKPDRHCEDNFIKVSRNS